MKKTLLLALSLFVFNHVYAQQQQELLKLVILEHLHNDVDFTDWSFENENYMVFYIKNGTDLCFANVTTNAQSYGTVSSIEYEKIDETSTTYMADYLTFRWSYINTYDDGKGSCLMELSRTYKENAVLFTLRMIDEKVNVSTYKGYVEGSLNLERY